MSGAARARFQGPVQADRRAGGALLVLQGIEHGSGLPLSVSFSGRESAPISSALTDVVVTEADEATPGATVRRWLLHSAAGEMLVQARAIHVQRDVSARFAAAVPACRASIASRAGWIVMLNLVRVPGVLRLMQRLRSRIS